MLGRLLSILVHALFILLIVVEVLYFVHSLRESCNSL